MGVLIPPETCERIKRLVPVHGVCAAAEIAGVSRTSVWRLKRRNWQPWSHDHERRPRPSDFAIQQRHMSHDELRAHYRAASATVTRWRREIRG
jgi:hypothetical protein